MSLRRKSVIAGSSGLAVGVLIIILVWATVGVLPPSAIAQSPVAIMVTDPPTTPAGTTALNLTYSGFTIMYFDSNTTGMNHVSITQTGTLNLEKLVNYSQVIGIQQLPVGAIIKSVALNVTSVSIMINGTVYPVTSLGNTLKISVPSAKITSNSNSGVLVDIHALVKALPAVSSSGQITTYFVFIPNAVAVFNPSITKVTPNTKIPIPTDDQSKLNFTQTSNLEITSSSLAVNGNTTKFSVTIKNTGAVNASVFGIPVTGTFNFTNNLTCQPVNQDGHNSTSKNDAFACPEFNFNMKSLKLTAIFRVSPNGTLMLSNGESEFQQFASGFIIPANSSATLTFTGVLHLGFASIDNSGESGNIHPPVLLPISGYTYSIRLLGQFPSMKTYYNVTAT